MLATATVITPRQHAEQIFEHATAGQQIAGDCISGASWLPGDAGLSYKVLRTETEPVKAKVRAFWELVRGAVTGAAVPAARLWR